MARYSKGFLFALTAVDLNTASLFFCRANIVQGVKLFTQHESLKIASIFRVCVRHPRIKHSSVPAEGREAAICHGLCPVLCLVSLVAAVLWIMTPVGR